MGGVLCEYALRLSKETTLAVAEVVSAHLSVSGGSRPAESFSDGFSSCKRRERDSPERFARDSRRNSGNLRENARD